MSFLRYHLKIHSITLNNMTTFGVKLIIKTMRYMKIFSTILTLLFSLTFSIAQHEHARCGMSHEDQKSLVEFVEYYNKLKESPNFSSRADKLNVPIRFHAVAKSDGTGRINPSQILKQFERLRVEFQAVDMNLYLYENGFNYLDNSSIYLNPGSSGSAIKNKKDPNALNIFVTENANTSSGMGTVLGFYSPADDYIIIRISDVAAVTASLSHELGHMFSLPHTFNGWEAEPYNADIHGNPLTITSTPVTTRPIELVDRSNCETSADKICDTPPDYNFGFTSNGCSYNQEIFDSNGDLIEPMIDNFMGYFIGCDSYQWSQGQIDVMRANWELNTYNGNNRSFLRSSYVPTSDTVNHDYSIIAPIGSSEYEDYVELEWEAAEGATAYQLEINILTGPNPRKIFEVVEGTSYELTDMGASAFINWSVTAYNESYGGAPKLNASFTTGTGSVATTDIAVDFENITLTPNPVNNGHLVELDFDSKISTTGNIHVYDVTGSLVFDMSNLNIRAGANSFKLETMGLNTGIHLVKIETEKGSLLKKLIVN